MVYLAKACAIPMHGNELPTNFDPVMCEGFKVMISTRENENKGKTYTNLFKIWRSEEPAIPVEPLKTENAGVVPSEVQDTSNQPIQGFPPTSQIPELAKASIGTGVHAGIQEIAESMPKVQEEVTSEKKDIF